MRRMHIEPPTPTVARLLQARRGSTLAVAALACTALISACGSSSSTPAATTTVDPTKIALAIQESILTKRHIHSTVTCPAGVPQEKGKTFVCTATTTSTKAPHTVSKVPFTVTVQSNAGYVTYVGE